MTDPTLASDAARLSRSVGYSLTGFGLVALIVAAALSRSPEAGDPTGPLVGLDGLPWFGLLFVGVGAWMVLTHWRERPARAVGGEEGALGRDAEAS